VKLDELARLPLACLTRELPHKLDHVVDREGPVPRPRELHPAFYGCYDWHSAVHGHWMLAKLGRTELFDQTLTPENIAVEVAYLRARPWFERTYGWAWLLALATQLRGTRWEPALRPLVDLVVELYREFLPKQTYPIRTGVHANTAFGMIFALQHPELEPLIVERARTYYGNDRDAPIAWEPGGEDFLSPALVEALLMKRVLPPEELAPWLAAFLPRGFDLPPATVTDRSDPKLAHLDGLNLSRAWCLRALGLPADAHLEAGLAHVATGDYAGEHWLATFAVLAVMGE
jgi:DUF2891 family protein